MFNIKRFRVGMVVVATALVATLAACSSTDPTNAPTPVASTAPTTPASDQSNDNETVTFTLDGEEYSFHQKDGEWTEKTFNKVHVLTLSAYGHPSYLPSRTPFEVRHEGDSRVTCEGDGACGYMMWFDSLQARCGVWIQFAESDRPDFETEFWVNTQGVRQPQFGVNPTWDHIQEVGPEGLYCVE